MLIGGCYLVLYYYMHVLQDQVLILSLVVVLADERRKASLSTAGPKNLHCHTVCTRIDMMTEETLVASHQQ